MEAWNSEEGQEISGIGRPGGNEVFRERQFLGPKGLSRYMLIENILPHNTRSQRRVRSVRGCSI